MTKKIIIKENNPYFEHALEVIKKFQWKISILIDNPLPSSVGNGKESYVGTIREIDKDYIYLDLVHNERLSKIILKKSVILSIWVYRQ